MPDYSLHSYDKAKWHYGADDFPDELEDIHGFTHTGFYLVWLADNDLISEFVKQDFKDELNATVNREKGPIHLYEMMDGCLIGDMLNEKGNVFSQSYFEKLYFGDYATAFPEAADVYSVEPSWDNYDCLVPEIEKRYQKWLKSKEKKPWQFWK